MSIHDYLRTHAREELPNWLAQHRPGDRFDRNAFFSSHVVFYPGSGTDGHPVQLFGSTHSAHTFIYADYGVTADRVKQELAPDGNPFAGYRTLDFIQLQMHDLTPQGWTPHAGPQDYRFVSTEPYGFVEILERTENKDDQHGPRRLALLFLGADGIATYDALFCQGDSTPAPLAVLIEDYGFGGQYPDGKFGRPGLLERIARQCAVMPRWLLVAENCEPWGGFNVVPDMEPDIGGSHARNRRLYERQTPTSGNPRALTRRRNAKDRGRIPDPSRLNPEQDLTHELNYMRRSFARILADLQRRRPAAGAPDVEAWNLLVERMVHDAVWASTELHRGSETKFLRQRFISQGVLDHWNSARTRKACEQGIQHEHVFRTATIKARLRVATNEQELYEALSTAVACVVTSNEHNQLKPKKIGDVEGWDRYSKARVRVWDRLEMRWHIDHPREGEERFCGGARLLTYVASTPDKSAAI
jgi:hypothetical protein